MKPSRFILLYLSMTVCGMVWLSGSGEPASIRLGGLAPPVEGAGSEVTCSVVGTVLTFTVANERAAACQLRILAPDGSVLLDTGPSIRPVLAWDSATLPDQWRTATLEYELVTLDARGLPAASQTGTIDFAAGDGGIPVVRARSYNVPGNFTVGGYLGVGTETPQRAIHIQGGNAVFRMDRSQDTAAFMIVRTNASSQILKAFVVGVNASGANQGAFVVNDLGQTTSGSGVNRLTIDNSGNAIFGSEIQATAFLTAASAVKAGVEPIPDALEKALRLRGVRFQWKETGARGLGLLAEEVAPVVPEAVRFDTDGRPAGVEYARLTALLLEAARAQQDRIDALEATIASLEAAWKAEIQDLREAKDGGPNH